jgi:NADPH:quinone reductase-like Zn-dependent oxidoreductase
MISKVNQSFCNRAMTAAALAVAAFVTGSALAADAVPAQMKAVRADTEGAAGAMKVVTVDVPKPGANQVLMRVYAASANPSDWGVRAGGAGPRAGAGGGAPGGQQAGGPPGSAPGGARGGMGGARSPGNDVAGVVVALGEGVKDFKVGDKVVAALQQSGGGAYAEYAVSNADTMSLKPKNFTFEQAAAIPTAGFTGLRMVILGNVKKGERVLVIGAAGGVGSTSVQAAVARGATVISSAKAQHDPYLKKIGVAERIAYDKEDVKAKAKDIDVAIVTVGSENANALTYVKRGGRVVTIAGQPDTAACTAAGLTCMTGGPGQGPSIGDLIKELVAMADKNTFQVIIDKSFPLEQINEAFALGRAGSREGKMAIAVYNSTAK